MNPRHPQYMKILHCGHVLCGGCAFNICRTDAPKCPICRHDIQHQLVTAQEPREDAVSQLRPKRDADDLHVFSPAVAPPGAFPTKYRGQCYVCDTPWTAGATVIKHRRLSTKIVCTGCAEAVMPCTECGDDASETDALKNGSGDQKRFFCRQCVQVKHASGEASHIRGATQFLKKRRAE